MRLCVGSCVAKLVRPCLFVRCAVPDVRVGFVLARGGGVCLLCRKMQNALLSSRFAPRLNFGTMKRRRRIELESGGSGYKCRAGECVCVWVYWLVCLSAYEQLVTIEPCLGALPAFRRDTTPEGMRLISFTRRLNCLIPGCFSAFHSYIIHPSSLSMAVACTRTRAHIIQKILSQGAGGEALQPREEKAMPPVRLCSLLPALSGFVRCAGGRPNWHAHAQLRPHAK